MKKPKTHDERVAWLLTQGSDIAKVTNVVLRIGGPVRTHIRGLYHLVRANSQVKIVKHPRPRVMINGIHYPFARLSRYIE